MKLKRKYTKGNKWIRKALNELAEDIYKWTPALPARRWDMTPSGLRLLMNERGDDYTPPFNPTISDQVSGNDKDLSLSVGYFHLPTNRPDGAGAPTSEAEIPLRRYEEFMPQLGGYDLDSASAVATLKASKTNEVWAVWGMDAITTQIGSTSYSAGAGSDLTMEDVASDLGTPVQTHTHKTQAQGVVIQDWISYVFQPSAGAIDITIHDGSLGVGVSGGGGGALDGPPAYSVQTTFAFQLGEITLDANGAETSRNWYVHNDLTPPIESHFQAHADSQNPGVSVA